MRKIPARNTRVATGIATPTAILVPCESPLVDWVYAVFVVFAVFIAVVPDVAEVAEVPEVPEVPEVAEAKSVGPAVDVWNRICTAFAFAPSCHSPSRL